MLIPLPDYVAPTAAAIDKDGELDKISEDHADSQDDTHEPSESLLSSEDPIPQASGDEPGDMPASASPSADVDEVASTAEVKTKP